MKYSGYGFSAIIIIFTVFILFNSVSCSTLKPFENDPLICKHADRWIDAERKSRGLFGKTERVIPESGTTGVMDKCADQLIFKFCNGMRTEYLSQYPISGDKYTDITIRRGDANEIFNQCMREHRR